MLAIYRLPYYSGDEYWSLGSVKWLVQAPSKDLLRKMTSAGFQFSPGVFTVKDADPEETLERFEQYVKAMRMAFGLNFDYMV